MIAICPNLFFPYWPDLVLLVARTTRSFILVIWHFLTAAESGNICRFLWECIQYQVPGTEKKKKIAATCWYHLPGTNRHVQILVIALSHRGCMMSSMSPVTMHQAAWPHSYMVPVPVSTTYFIDVATSNQVLSLVCKMGRHCLRETNDHDEQLLQARRWLWRKQHRRRRRHRRRRASHMGRGRRCDFESRASNVGSPLSLPPFPCAHIANEHCSPSPCPQTICCPTFWEKPDRRMGETRRSPHWLKDTSKPFRPEKEWECRPRRQFSSMPPPSQAPLRYSHRKRNNWTILALSSNIPRPSLATHPRDRRYPAWRPPWCTAVPCCPSTRSMEHIPNHPYRQTCTMPHHLFPPRLSLETDKKI